MFTVRTHPAQRASGTSCARRSPCSASSSRSSRSACCGRSSTRGTRARRRSASTRLITRNAISLVVLAAASLRAEDPRRSTGVDSGVAGPTGSAASTSPKQLLPAVRDRGRDRILDMYPGVPHRRRTSARRSCATARARSSGASSRDKYGWKVGDPFRSAARSSRAPGRSRCARSTTARDAKTDTTQFFFHWDYLNETMQGARSRGARTRSASSSWRSRDADARGRGLASAIDASSRTRSPRRSPRPSRPSSSASSR